MFYIAKFEYLAQGPREREHSQPGPYEGTIELLCSTGSVDRALKELRTVFQQMAREEPGFCDRVVSVTLEFILQVERAPTRAIVFTTSERVSTLDESARGSSASATFAGHADFSRLYTWEVEDVKAVPAFAEFDGKGGVSFETGFRDEDVDSDDEPTDG
jgi:hypothetical protein